MAGSGLLALLDDITVLLDDVAAMSKVAVQKTAGIAGDDLAVGAESMIGLDPRRELPIVAKVAMGSLVNKAILIPLALALPAAAITPLLMAGGAFLCYEGVHKMTHKKGAQDEKEHQQMLQAAMGAPEDLAAFEKKKVMAAIGTDTVLSAEIIAITLGAVAEAPLATKALTMTTIGIGMTIAIYGLVAAIVKMDDLGLVMQRARGDAPFAKNCRAAGTRLVSAMPGLMRVLSVVGTAAMFMVGGSILIHGIPPLHHAITSAGEAVDGIPLMQGIVETALYAIGGIIAGFLATPVFKMLGKNADRIKTSAAPLLRRTKQKR